MSMIERDPGLSVEKGHAAGSAPSEFAINTPTRAAPPTRRTRWPPAESRPAAGWSAAA